MGRIAVEYYDGDQALELFKKSLLLEPANKHSMTNLLACNPHRLKAVDIELGRKKIVYSETEEHPKTRQRIGDLPPAHRPRRLDLSAFIG